MGTLTNLLRPERGIEGGLFLPEQKAVTARLPIETVFVDGPLHIPLQPRRDLLAKLDVQPGERVLAGQRLASPLSSDGVPVHAPTSGRVVERTRVWTVHDGYLPGIVLVPDGKDDWPARALTWESESFIAQLAEGGVRCPLPRMPAHQLIQQAAAQGVTDLIVNGMETEPYLTADLRTLVEEPGRIVDATCEVADALGVRRALIALPFRHRRVVKRMRAEAAGRKIEICPLANRYPQCHPVLLVKTLLDREVAPGQTPESVGAVVLPLATVRMAATAVFEGRPVTHAVMTVAGDAADRPGTYRVPVGTPLGRLARRVGLLGPVLEAVGGGPLTGVCIGRDDAVVTPELTALLLFSEVERARPVPCIRCGWCVEDCPVGLDPSELLHCEAEDACSHLTLSHLKACIDCGLCSYVCPAKLPLAASISRSRTRLGRRPSARPNRVA